MPQYLVNKGTLHIPSTKCWYHKGLKFCAPNFLLSSANITEY